jgi:thymidylate kinase
MKYLDVKHRGKFLVVYGPNNVGKSTQFGLLASRLTRDYHQQVLFLKYPIYELSPTGPELHNYIKGKSIKDKKLSPIELQSVYAKNRYDFQSIVEACLKAGVHVIAEDYIGTGLAWGMTYGASINELLKINNYLLMPDVSILLLGTRFRESIEPKHIFENAGDEVWNKNKACFQKLAKRFSWKVIKSDDTIEKVHNNIMKIVGKELGIA